MANVIVIDDNHHTADAMVGMLELLGVSARAVYGPGQAVRILKIQAPKIVFLDINMPGLSGFEVLSYIKREPHLSSVPVFVVTSDDQPETRKKAIQAGAAKVLLKPASVDVLEEALKEAGVL